MLRSHRCRPVWYEARTKVDERVGVARPICRAVAHEHAAHQLRESVQHLGLVQNVLFVLQYSCACIGAWLHLEWVAPFTGPQARPAPPYIDPVVAELPFVCDAPPGRQGFHV